MHLPHLNATHVVHLRDATHSASSTIPAVPFALLLLHKLQGWDDHRKAEEAYKNQKQHQDAADVRRLLALRHESELLAKNAAVGQRRIVQRGISGPHERKGEGLLRGFPRSFEGMEGTRL